PPPTSEAPQDPTARRPTTEQRSAPTRSSEAPNIQQRSVPTPGSAAPQHQQRSALTPGRTTTLKHGTSPHIPPTARRVGNRTVGARLLRHAGHGGVGGSQSRRCNPSRAARPAPVSEAHR